MDPKKPQTENLLFLSDPSLPKLSVFLRLKIQSTTFQTCRNRLNRTLAVIFRTNGSTRWAGTRCFQQLLKSIFFFLLMKTTPSLLGQRCQDVNPVVGGQDDSSLNSASFSVWHIKLLFVFFSYLQYERFHSRRAKQLFFS